MNSGTDLFTILRLYANKNRIPQVSVAVFLQFLEKYAKHYEAERADLAYWSQDTGRKVWAELSKLAEQGKIELITDEAGTVIAIHQFYIDVIQQAYKNIDESAELPFPDESSLGIVVPAHQIRNINIEYDLPNLIAQPPQDNPPILKLTFPDNSGSALLLSPMIQKRLLEIALLKVRHYLRSHNNKEYLQHKLAPAFHGKETQLRDTLNHLLVRPFDAIRDMENSGDFIYPFWAYLCTQIKNDIKKKNDRLPEDIAALQAVLIVEVYNNYFKGKVTREKEAETAFRNLELQLEKAPFFYTLDEIIRFTDTKGVPLLGQYTQEALEHYLKAKTTTTEAKETLPDLLIVLGHTGEKWFIKKNKMLVLCFKLLGEVRPKVKTAISQRWYRLMQNYETEPAMQNEEAFEQELWELIDRLSPPLSALLNDKKLYLVHTEFENGEHGIPEHTRLFYKGSLVPLSELLLLKQKDLLTDVKVLLPFWYSLPIISSIIAFFKQQRKKLKKVKKNVSTVAPQHDLEEIETDERNNSGVKQKDHRKELREVALKARSSLIPEGHTLDSYMDELRDHWNRLINVEAKNNLTEDVNSLIRDYLRRTIRSLKHAHFTADRISNLAEALVNTPNLQKLPAQESLKLYIQLYIIKLLSE
ncbi:hypothetical protein [Gracilinema caldarium]|nr:hypothetical protein [Gracilinema caldarium]